MVFGKKKNLNYSFILQDKQLEVVEKFSYLGIIFKYNGTFFYTKKKLVDQAQRSLHFIYKTIRNERAVSRNTNILKDQRKLSFLIKRD